MPVDGPVVAMWGTSDVDNFGDHLFPRIARLELGRRGCRVRPYGPMGWLHPTRMDGGEPSEPLGPYEPARLDALAAAADAVLVGGGEIIHTRDELLAPHYGIAGGEARALQASRFFIDGLGRRRERHCPVVWHAVGLPFDFGSSDASRLARAVQPRPYVAVRDDLSRRRLEAAGVEREITVVPDSGFLLPRLLPKALLDKRLAYLRVMGGFPVEGAAVVVQGNRDLVADAGPIAAAVRSVVAERPDLTVVLLETGAGHGDGEFADALSHHLEGHVARLRGVSSVEDIAATVAAAELFVGISLHGNVAAAAYDRPSVILDLNGQSKLAGLSDALQRPEVHVEHVDDLADAMRYAIEKPPRRDVVLRLQARIDDHFDRVADLAGLAARERGTGSPVPAVSAAELAAVRRAHEQLARRAVAERVAMADRVVDIEEQLAAAAAGAAEMETHVAWLAERLAATEEAVAWHSDRRAAAEEELRGIRETKIFRWTSPARDLWAWWHTRRS